MLKNNIELLEEAIMQNLPFLVAQNAPVKNATAKAGSQKADEPDVSFKQVLTKQVSKEAPKEHVAKASPGKSEKLHVQVEEKQMIQEVEVQGQLKAADTNIDSADLALSGVSLFKPDTESLDVETEDATVQLDVQAAPQNDNAALIASLNLPVTHNTVKSLPEPDKKMEIVNTGIVHNQKVIDVTQGAADGKQRTPDMHESEKKADRFATNLANNMKEDNKTLNGKILHENSPELSEKLSQLGTDKQLKEPMLTQVASILPASIQVAAQPISPQLPVSSLDRISVYPGKPGWDQAISQKVVWMVGASEQSATLTLNPPDLGPLQVVVNVNNDKADTTFISDNPEVRLALENGLSTLRDLMDQAGIELGQTNISSGKEQQAFQQAAKERAQQPASANTMSSPQSAEKPMNAGAASRSSNGLVDTFA